jgi:hypothetical protein
MRRNTISIDLFFSAGGFGRVSSGLKSSDCDTHVHTHAHNTNRTNATPISSDIIVVSDGGGVDATVYQ